MPKTVNQKVRDSLIKHALDLLAQQEDAINEITRMLKQLSRDLNKQLQNASTDWQRDRIETMLREMDRLIAAAGAGMEQRTAAMLERFASGELSFALDTVRSGSLGLIAVQTVAIEKVLAAASTQPFNGRIMHDWFRSWAHGMKESVRQQVMIGFVEGETITQIRNRIIGAASQRALIGGSSIGSRLPYQRITPSLMTARRNASTIVRTAMNHYSEAAHNEIWMANADIIKGLQWVSTLDERTTEICQDRDGEVYDLGEGPRPPAHPNCRSTMIPVMKSWRELGIDRDELPPSTRASANGQVAATLTYHQWKKQLDDE